MGFPPSCSYVICSVTDCSADVAQEIIDVLVAAKKHEILLLTRKVRIVSALVSIASIVAADWPGQDAPAHSGAPGLEWVKADYGDPKQLAQILQGVHTVLSFIATVEDPASTVQKNLIDAAVQAGVKRFAPSEWSTWAVLISDIVSITDLLQIRPGASELVCIQGRNSAMPQRAEQEQEGKLREAWTFRNSDIRPWQ